MILRTSMGPLDVMHWLVFQERGVGPMNLDLCFDIRELAADSFPCKVSSPQGT